MQRLEVSGAVQPLYGSLGFKGLTAGLHPQECPDCICGRQMNNFHMLQLSDYYLQIAFYHSTKITR
jgi:hypothetical protein